MLDKEKLDIIQSRIKSQGVYSDYLLEELTDHISCIIEDEMLKGKSFDESYQLACNAVSPGGMNEIQEQLNFILTNKKSRIMKKLFTRGFISMLLIFMGLLFASLRYPGAAILLILGCGFFTFLFLIPIGSRSNMNLFITKVGLSFVPMAILLYNMMSAVFFQSSSRNLFVASLVWITLYILPILFYSMYDEVRTGLKAPKV